METRSDRFARVEDGLADYQVCDRHGDKIGKVGDLFVDDLNDQLEYIGVKTGLFDLRSTLIPADVVWIDVERQLIEVFQSKDKLKDAPNFDDLEEVTAEFERQVRSYFGLESAEPTGERQDYKARIDEAYGERYPGVTMSGVDQRARGVPRAAVLAEYVGGRTDHRPIGTWEAKEKSH
jgi:hypothetical protein